MKVKMKYFNMVTFEMQRRGLKKQTRRTRISSMGKKYSIHSPGSGRVFIFLSKSGDGSREGGKCSCFREEGKPRF